MFSYINRRGLPLLYYISISSIVICWKHCEPALNCLLPKVMCIKNDPTGQMQKGDMYSTTD